MNQWAMRIRGNKGFIKFNENGAQRVLRLQQATIIHDELKMKRKEEFEAMVRKENFEFEWKKVKVELEVY